MIVYNVQRRWFTMKNDAEAHRRAKRLPPSATYTLRIDTREELAALLNGLCNNEPAEVPSADPDVTLTVAEDHMIGRNQVTNEPPDFVPRFLAKEWEDRQKGVYR